ncbi:NUDIX hydrolase [Cohaesibacter intestini]|uniref:NUDIX hydrolase n=1 Tax=Cohaesibacter intestini TaxID=2211145 RepID=UPI001300A3CC|nr:NUDIX hydrolase [Cohaesibacter intestini]
MANDRSYPARPFLGVSALVLHNGHVLLAQRGNPPAIGVWSLPGGAVETGEALSASIKRELMEEAGLQIDPLYVADLVEILRHDASGRCERHFVIAVFFCTVRDADGMLPPVVAGDDAMDVRWVSPDALSDYALTDGTLAVIEKILSGTRMLT